MQPVILQFTLDCFLCSILVLCSRAKREPSQHGPLQLQVCRPMCIQIRHWVLPEVDQHQLFCPGNPEACTPEALTGIPQEAGAFASIPGEASREGRVSPVIWPQHPDRISSVLSSSAWPAASTTTTSQHFRASRRRRRSTRKLWSCPVGKKHSATSREKVPRQC